MSLLEVKELNFAYGHNDWSDDGDKVTHYAFLTGHGYQPTAWEQERLGAKKARR